MASWLIESYVLVGRTNDAETLFSQMCGLAGHTGLLSEEYDPATGEALGNVPQGYSHLGLINSALMLAGR
jgi:trehalose 6-phosphate phosphatase